VQNSHGFDFLRRELDSCLLKKVARPRLPRGAPLRSAVPSADMRAIASGNLSGLFVDRIVSLIEGVGREFHAQPRPLVREFKCSPTLVS
jgi:hypothetical protein